MCEFSRETPIWKSLKRQLRDEKLKHLRIQMQIHKRFKRTLLIRIKPNMRIFGVIPFIKLQNDTYTTIKQWKTMKDEM